MSSKQMQEKNLDHCKRVVLKTHKILMNKKQWKIFVLILKPFKKMNEYIRLFQLELISALCFTFVHVLIIIIYKFCICIAQTFVIYYDFANANVE